MNHPIAFIFITRIQIVVAYIKKLLNVVGEIIDKRIAVPYLVKNYQWKFIWTRRWHVAFRSKQWTCMCMFVRFVVVWMERREKKSFQLLVTYFSLFTGLCSYACLFSMLNSPKRVPLANFCAVITIVLRSSSQSMIIRPSGTE